VLTEVPRRRWLGRAPVQLRNPRAARPFERLVAFLGWPQSGSIDPTRLMAVVLPVLFGIMVGDIGYGLLLAGLGWWVRRRWGRRSAVAGDAGRVLLVGGALATVFGVLYGELFGNLGRYALGLPALWFYRGAPDALPPLLLFVLGVGAAHLVLGLLLGLWQAARRRNLPHLLERGGSLLVLAGLFGIAGVVASLLPGGALPTAAAAVAIGLVVCSVPHGPLGALLGPLEALSRIGDVLSYLRLAAVGLASVYLAIVANELGRQAPLLVGIVIATLLHALNLALAAFTPMIQSMRLHYVEFFGTFFDDGGRPFRPLGTTRRTPTPAATRRPAVSAAP
jgi:V/A-type H+-transporting ATPase subunit I